MAVTATGLRQTNPLIDELLKRAMQQGSSSVNQYTAESFGGNFPIGSLTADVLKGVRRRTAENQAQMAIDDKNQAMADLLAVRGDDRYTIDASGNITERTMVPREQVDGFDQSQLGQTERMMPTTGEGTGAVIDSSVAKAMGTSTEDEAQNLAIALKASQARETTGLPASQLEQEVLKEEVTPTKFRYGPEQDPNFFERNVLGKKLKGEEISNINQLAIKAGISPFDLQKYDIQEKRLSDEFEFKKREFITKETKARNDEAMFKVNILGKNLDNINKQIKNETDVDTLNNLKQKQTDINFYINEAKDKNLKGDELATYLGDNLLKKGHIKEANDLLDRVFKKDSKKSELLLKYQKDETATFKPINKALKAYNNLINALEENTGTAAYTAMISYIKQLDDSVVREGEVALFRNFQGIYQNLKNQVQQIKGENFTEEVKKTLKDLATKNIESLMGDYNLNKADSVNNFYKPNGYNVKEVYKGLNYNTSGLGLSNFILGNDVEDWRDF